MVLCDNEIIAVRSAKNTQETFDRVYRMIFIATRPESLEFVSVTLDLCHQEQDRLGG